MLRPNVFLSNKREGRGFSPAELEKAGLNYHQAKLLSLSVDKRRTSVHEENVKVLQYLKQEAQKAATSKVVK